MSTYVWILLGIAYVVVGLAVSFVCRYCLSYHIMSKHGLSSRPRLGEGCWCSHGEMGGDLVGFFGTAGVFLWPLILPASILTLFILTVCLLAMLMEWMTKGWEGFVSGVAHRSVEKKRKQREYMEKLKNHTGPGLPAPEPWPKPCGYAHKEMRRDVFVGEPSAPPKKDWVDDPEKSVDDELQRRIGRDQG